MGTIDLTKFDLQTGAFTDEGNTSPGTFSLEAGSTDLRIRYTAVPEPTTATLLGGGAALGLLRRRRKTSR